VKNGKGYQVKTRRTLGRGGVIPGKDTCHKNLYTPTIWGE